MKVSGSFDQDEGHARAWLTERADYHERREQWISARDLILDLVIIALIGWEIHLGYQQERLQSRNFKEQQQSLTNLQNSSAETAKTLASLQRTTELMNTTLQMQLDALKKSATETARSAKAGEASAATASQAMHISERAYVHLRASLSKPPAAGEKPQISIRILNTGRTPAVELTPDCRAVFLSSPSSPEPMIESVREAAFANASLQELQKWQSISTLPSGQTSEVPFDLPRPLTQPEVDQLLHSKAWLCIFATVAYKDVFNQHHQTEICGIYDPRLNVVFDCHEHNKSD